MWSSKKSGALGGTGVLVLTFLGILLGALPAFAEEGAQTVVRLVNGDRLSGQLQQMVGGKLLLETAYAGVVEIDGAAIETLESTVSVVVEFGEGERVEGPLSLSGGQIQVAGRELSWSEVTAFNPPTPPAVRWQLDLSLGANLQRGNSESTALHLAATGYRETDRGKLSGRLAFSETDEGDVTTVSNTFLGLQYDFQLRGKSFLYVKGDFLEDEFKDLNLRSVLGLGIGYPLRDDDRLKIQVQGGLAYLDEDFIINPDQDELTVEAGYDLAWTLGWGTFTERLLVRPSFEDDSYQFRLENTLTTTLAGDWALKLAAILDYDSEPPAGVEEDDLLFIAALQYSLTP